MPNKLNVAKLINGAQKVLDAVQELAPLAQQFGGPTVSGVATIVIATTNVIENVLERGKDADVAMTTQDEAKLRAMLSELQPVNDRLAGQIAQS